MRKTAVVLILCVILVATAFAGCIGWGEKKEEKAENKPPINQGSGTTQPLDGPGTSGPYYHQIYSATSTDGISWVTNNTMVFDHASVPGAVYFNDKLYLYYVNAADPEHEKLSVGVSEDKGATFTVYDVQITGPNSPYPVDPNPIVHDGKIRLTYLGNFMQGGINKIVTATASDGINFNEDGVIFTENVFDPDLFYYDVGSQWVLFVSNGTNLTKATSSSPTATFTKDTSFSWTAGGMASTHKIGGKYYTYYAGMNGISVAEYSNGVLSNVTDGIVAFPNMVADPTVAVFGSNDYKLFFKTMVGGGQPEEQITVNFTGSTYKSVTKKPSGWFTSGQNADIMLSGIDFNNTGGPLLFNHQGNVATDGTRLLLADRNNNRVLIWNSLPTGNSEPNIVLGQKDFYSNNPGIGLNQMNWPVGVATDGVHVVVADTYNDRILIWNTFPTNNGQSANLVIQGDPDPMAEPKKKVGWPWGVWTDNGKLVVGCTASSSVLIWNTFPTQNNQSADIRLTAQGDFGTPRTITSNGTNLIVGDHNPSQNASPSGNQGNFFWNSFPTTDDQPYSFFMSDPSDPRGAWMQGGFTPDGKLVMLGVNLYIWNSFPTGATDSPDLTLGTSGYRFDGGDGSGAVVAGGRLYLSLSNGNKIVGFNSLPTNSSAHPDFAVSAPDIYTNTLETNYFITNPVPVSDGESLFVSSDFDRKLYVWKNLPDESGAKPDIVYSLPFPPWDNALFENTLVLAGRETVCIWETLPRNGGLPDLWFKGGIGNVTFQDLRGVALDNKYFYLADKTANKIYVWEGIPNNNTTNPKFSINIEGPTRLSSDGTYLVAAATEAAFDKRIKFYKIDELSSSAEGTLLTGINVNLPQATLAVDGHLFIGDTGFNRVLVWNNISDAVAGSPPDVVLGEEDFNDTLPEIGVNKLFWPAAMTFDGSYLWVGEFKFSGRILRFSPTEQGNWEKEVGIRVPDGVSSCTIMLPNGTYRMYYTGMNGILSAFSEDGLNWIVEDGVRISPGVTGSNQSRVCNCAIIEGGPGFYRMIYEGVQGEPPNDVHRFFSANSTDGLTWTKEEGIRLESVGTSDYGQVSVPDMIELLNESGVHGTFRMYYVGDFYHQGTEGNSIRSAISHDFGLTWTREGSMLIGEDTMDPDVIRRGGDYRMFYTASPPGQKPGNQTVYSALSEDGLTWWNKEFGLRVASGGVYDMKNCMDPDVIELPNGSYRMYYSGMNPNGETNILSALRLPFSIEGNFTLDFSETQFNFTYPMDRLYFRFKCTNTGTKSIFGNMEECHAPAEGGGSYVHVATPQGTNFLAPGESTWIKIILGSEPYGKPPSPEGTYNFTLHMRCSAGLPDRIQADAGGFFVNKTLQIKVINRTTLAGDVVLQGRIVDENGFPIRDLEFDIGVYQGKTGTRTDADGHFSYSIAESQAYFLVIQKPGYRGFTLEIDGNNVQDFYNITLTKETSSVSINSTLINSVTGNIGFWRCAATADESKLLLVNGMEIWEDPSFEHQYQSKLYLLDVNTGETIWTHDMGWESWTADITDDGKYAVFGTNLQWPEYGPEGFINYIRLLNGTDGSTIWQKNITSENFPEYFKDGQSYTRGMKFSHSGEYIIVAVECEYVYLLNRSDGSIKWRKWVSQNVREILFTQDDQYVYISGGNGQLYKVRVEDGSEVWKQWTGAWACVNGLDLSSDEQYIAVAAKGATLSVINTTDGSIRFSGDGYACRFSHDGSVIAVGRDAPPLKILDLDGNLLWGYYMCDSQDIRFSGDSSLIFVGSGQVFNTYGTLLHEIGNTQGGFQVGWLNSNATRFVWAVRDTPASENNIIEVYSIETSLAPQFEEGDWIKESGIRIEDGSVPYVLRLDNGSYRLYYNNPNGIFSAISSDGLNFIKENGVRLNGTGILGDPERQVHGATVVKLDNGSYNGSYRMYYVGATGDGGPGHAIHRIYSAISNDGLNFVREGIRIESNGTIDNGWASVPEIVRTFDGKYRLYYCTMGACSIGSAISDDGLNFVREYGPGIGNGTGVYGADPAVCKLPNGTYRMFFTEPGGAMPPWNLSEGIYSAWSEDGVNFTLESGVRVLPGGIYDNSNVFDPAVIQLPNGSFRMYYGGQSNMDVVTLSAISPEILIENQPPTAYIDSILPNPAAQGETVTFIGHGDDPDGSIAAYNWRSSINGFLSNQASFSISTLSVGTHTIYFKVQDNNGTWSSEVYEMLVINPSAQPTLVVTVNANPTTVNSGENSTITITVTDGTNPVSGATINLQSDNGGSFSTVTDNGNGTYTATFTAPSVTSQTICRVTATASKIGYNSGSGYIDVTVNPAAQPSLYVTVTANPTTLTSGTSSTITATITDGTNAVSGVTVQFSSNYGGTFSPSATGTTNTNGVFSVTFIAPTVSSQTICRITANASKTGYIDGNGYKDITIYPVGANPPQAVTLSSPTEITKNSLKLSWSQNNDSDFANYTIYQSTTSRVLGNVIKVITTNTTTSWTVTGLSPSTTYYFTVRVYDTAGLHNDSNQVSGTTLTAVTTGNLTGTLTDKNGKPIEGATVSIVATNHKTWTDANGRYTFTDVSASSYGVKAEKTGYKTKTETGVVINAGVTTTLNIVLEEEKKAEPKGFIPGFETFLLLIVLAGCAVLLKHRKRFQ